MDMCRFSGPDDVEYEKIEAALQKVLATISKSSESDNPRTLTEDERRRYLDTLKFDQIESRHATIKAAHAKTCAWLLQKPEYKDWRDTEKLHQHLGFLWIKGKPGTGKSTLMKYIYAQARRKKSITVIAFFFNARGESWRNQLKGCTDLSCCNFLRAFLDCRSSLICWNQDIRLDTEPHGTSIP